MAYRKENYRMFGNAVCPPLIAALAGAVLAHCKLENQEQVDWIRRGHDTSISIALACTRVKPVDVPIGCRVVATEEKKIDI